MLGMVRKAVLKWAGHVSRMEENRMVKRIIDGRVDGTRSRGRPKVRWMDAVLEATGRLGLTENWRTVARDKKEWKRLLDEEAEALNGL